MVRLFATCLKLCNETDELNWIFPPPPLSLLPDLASLRSGLDPPTSARPPCCCSCPSCRGSPGPPCHGRTAPPPLHCTQRRHTLCRTPLSCPRRVCGRDPICHVAASRHLTIIPPVSDLPHCFPRALTGAQSFSHQFLCSALRTL